MTLDASFASDATTVFVAHLECQLCTFTFHLNYGYQRSIHYVTARDVAWRTRLEFLCTSKCIHFQTCFSSPTHPDWLCGQVIYMGGEARFLEVLQWQREANRSPGSNVEVHGVAFRHCRRHFTFSPVSIQDFLPRDRSVTFLHQAPTL